MCYRPINIVNQAKHLFPAQRFKFSVPCGVCFQCQRQKSLEYELRSYYEFLDCLKKGGYVYTDCLTYSDEYLPHLKEFLSYIPKDYNYPCFSYVDFRLFMVRLRQHLTRAGFDVKNTLRYFMASEYGTSEGCTHRPHYHVIFYVTTPNLTNVDLSKAISTCWQLGRTDGLPFKTIPYINNHTYKGVVADGDILKTIQYISKYVAKQNFYNTLVFKRLDSLYNYFGYDKDSKEYKQLTKDVKRYSFQFHRQSSGFGLAALESVNNTPSELIERGCFIYKSLKSTVFKVPIPQYFARKLFYDITRSVDGSLHWYLNDVGIKFRQEHLDDVIDSYSLKLESLYSNLQPSQKDEFDRLLNGRSFRSFAEYVLVFKGRLKSDAQLKREKEGVFYCDDAYSFNYLSLQPFLDSVFYNYNSQKDKTAYGTGITSLLDINNTNFYPVQKYRLTTARPIAAHLRLLHTVYPRFDIAKMISANKVPFCFTNQQMLAYVVNEHSDPRFENFDSLFRFVSDCLCRTGRLQQQAYNTIQRISNMYKSKNLL